MPSFRQFSFLLIGAVLVWASYLFGRQLASSVSGAWRRYVIVLALYGFALLVLLTPLGTFLVKLQSMTNENESASQFGWGELANAGLAFLVIVVPGFIGISTAPKGEDAIIE